MNKDEIKKALECCQDYDYESCIDCPYRKHSEDCTNDILKDALKLINGQEKEIERLKAENKQSNTSKILGNSTIVEFHDDIISEQPAVSVDSKDFEKYAKSFRNRIISLDETVKKQAKIDVLNELKQVIHDDIFDQLCPDCAKAGASVLEQIDDMIEELKK